MQHTDAIAPCGFIHQMGRHDDGRVVLAAELLQVFPHVAPRARIEAGARLVEDQQLRRRQERLGQLSPAPESSRQRAHQLRRPVVESDQGEHGANPLGQATAVETVQAAMMPQVLVDAELKIERGRLEHDADLPAHVLRLRDNIASEYPGPEPSAGVISVETILNNVVLPPPFGPSSPKSSPTDTLKLTAVSAARLPYRWLRLEISRASVPFQLFVTKGDSR